MQVGVKQWIKHLDVISCQKYSPVHARRDPLRHIGDDEIGIIERDFRVTVERNEAFRLIDPPCAQPAIELHAVFVPVGYLIAWVAEQIWKSKIGEIPLSTCVAVQHPPGREVLA